MSQNWACIDIETAPNANLVPPQFEAPSTWKDPEKIARFIQEKQDKWIEEAALHAERARVLCIGIKMCGKDCVILEGPECAMLAGFSEFIRKVSYGHPLAIICGHNIKGFDLPFIRKRCIINRIETPWYDRTSRWNPWTFPVLDTMEEWQSGGDKHERISLDELSVTLGGERKAGDSALFYKLYEQDREAAVSHLTNHLEITAAIVERML